MRVRPFIFLNLLFLLTFYFFTPFRLISQTTPIIQWSKCYGGKQWTESFKVQQTKDGGYIIAGTTDDSNDGDVSGPIYGSIPNSDAWIVKTDAKGNIQWQKKLGGSLKDEAVYVQQTQDGGYIVAGSTWSNDGDVVGHHGQNADYWIVKLNAVGNVLWSKCYGGDLNDVANAVLQTNDGGYIIAGWSKSIDGDVTGNHPGTGGSSIDYWIVKIDGLGNMQWQKSYGGSGDDMTTSMAQATDGGYVVAGFSYSNDGDVTGNHGLNDYWLIKIDKTGNIQWQKSYGGSISEIPYAIKPTSDGGYIVAGISNSDNGDVSGNHGNNDYWILKIDNVGNIQWQKSLGGSGGDYALDVIQNSTGEFVISGWSDSRSLLGVNGDVKNNHGGKDFWIVCLNKTGNIQWQKSLGGSSDDYGYSIQQTADLGYVVCGYSQSFDGDVNGRHGNIDIWVVKLGLSQIQECIPSITIVNNTLSACSGSLVTFNAFINNGGALPSYQWKINGIKTGANAPSFATNSLVKGDIVICELISSAGCAIVNKAISNAIVMDVKLPPTISILASDTAICETSKVVFTVSVSDSNANPSYQWRLNGNNIQGAASSAINNLTLTDNDTIDCLLRFDNGCIGSVYSNKIVMHVDKVPIVLFIPDTLIYNGISTVLKPIITGNNILLYKWTPADYLDADTILNPTASPVNTTTYKLRIQTRYGCNSSGNLTLKVNDIFIPNAFSPNGDGINDNWKITGLPNADCTVDVYDRYGSPVFHSVGYNYPWDAYYNNMPVPSGTYYYIIKIKSTNKIFSGSVTLFR